MALKLNKDPSVPVPLLWEEKDGLTHFCEHYKRHSDFSSLCNRNLVFNSWLVFPQRLMLLSMPAYVRGLETLGMLALSFWGPVFTVISVKKDLNGQDFLRGHHSKEPPSQLTYHHNPTMPIGGLGDRAGERPFGSIKTEPTVAYLINTLLLHCAWGCVTTLTLLSPSMTLPHLDTPVPPSVLVVQQSSWISGSTQVVSEQMMLWCL